MAKKKSITVKATSSKPSKKNAAAKKAAAKTTLENETRPIVSRVFSPTGFQLHDYVQVVHDNDPCYAGNGGCVTSADGLVQVALSYDGKTVTRSYMPSQLRLLTK